MASTACRSKQSTVLSHHVDSTVQRAIEVVRLRGQFGG